MPTKKELKPKAKPVKKPVAKKRVKPPVITDEMFDKWFFKLDAKYFVQLQREWNERNLKINLTNQPDYDAWLNYFKTLSPNVVKLLAVTGQDILNTEAYAALSRWHDIIGNPHRIDKIHQSGLTNSANKPKDHKTIVQLALENDRLGVLKATRDQIAEKLEKGAGARDTAALARELTEVMTAISDYEKRIGPKKTTMLGQLLQGMPGAQVSNPDAKKRPGKNGGGKRNTSYASRVTIKDIEE